ncbi:hypothetical protein SAMD00019534_090330, partial [Acytostelium subglobosum LB1]|uniref:hypothetical protein n=1 Tax=Acytostelium subglobosum LB1 TaxID=1410327 RepID=UPI000644B2D0
MIIYSLVAEYSTGCVLVESNDVYSPALTLITRKILKLLQSKQLTNKKSYKYANNYIHYLPSPANNASFMCISDSSSDSNVAFELLVDISNEWSHSYSLVNHLKTDTKYTSLTDSFQTLLNKKMQQYSERCFGSEENSGYQHVADMPSYETIEEGSLESGVSNFMEESSSMHIHMPPEERDESVRLIGIQGYEAEPTQKFNMCCCGHIALNFSLLFKLLLVIFLIACVYTLVAISCKGFLFQGCYN